MAEIRAESPRDGAAVHEVNGAAFGRPDEAAPVDAMRDAGVPLVSVVAAADDGMVVGHILFVTVEPEPPSGLREAGLAPLAVLPPANGEALAWSWWRAGSKNAGAADTTRSSSSALPHTTAVSASRPPRREGCAAGTRRGVHGGGVEARRLGRGLWLGQIPDWVRRALVLRAARGERA